MSVMQVGLSAIPRTVSCVIVDTPTVHHVTVCYTITSKTSIPPTLSAPIIIMEPMEHASRLEQRLFSTSSTPPLHLHSPSLTVEGGGVYYTEATKTPDALNGGRYEGLEGGALRAGGLPNLYSRENIGLLAQYAATGIVHGSVWAVNYPLLTNYLHMDGVKTASVVALLALPSTWRMFFGILSDCYPIFGFRRRPYIVIGWLVTFVACLIMAVTPVGDPYYPDPSWRLVPESTLLPEQAALLNKDAPSAGTKYVLLLVLANLGSVLALTAADGMVVEFAQREPESVRGTVQIMVAVAQSLFQCVSQAMIGLGLNTIDYGGSWQSGMSFNSVMGVCAVASLVIIPISWLCISEQKAERQSPRVIFASIYAFIQQRVVYEIIAFRFFRNFFSFFSVTAMFPIQSLWAQVTPLNNSIATILGCLLSALGWGLTKQYGLQWNWRTMIILTQVMVIVIDAVPTFLTIWDVYRAQWFWLGGPLLETLPASVGFMISTFVVVEIIDLGNEASVFGLIATVSTIAAPFSTVLTKNVDAHFDIDFVALQTDDRHAHEQVTYAYLVAYGFKLFSLVFLVWLPRQKKETQALKATGGTSKFFGNLTICYLVFAFCWSLMTNLMTFSSTTSCLKIAGGNGCKLSLSAPPRR